MSTLGPGSAGSESDSASDLRRFFALLDHSPAFAALLLGHDLTFAYSNHAHDALIGDRPTQGKQLCEAIPEAKAIGLADGIEGVLQSGEPFAVADLPLNLATGHRRVNVLLQPYADARGNVVGVFVQGIDITDRA